MCETYVTLSQPEDCDDDAGTDCNIHLPIINQSVPDAEIPEEATPTYFQDNGDDDDDDWDDDDDDWDDDDDGD